MPNYCHYSRLRAEILEVSWYSGMESFPWYLYLCVPTICCKIFPEMQELQEPSNARRTINMEMAKNKPIQHTGRKSSSRRPRPTTDPLGHFWAHAFT